MAGAPACMKPSCCTEALACAADPICKCLTICHSMSLPLAECISNCGIPQGHLYDATMACWEAHCADVCPKSKHGEST